MSRDQSLLTHCLMVCAPGLGWAYPNFDDRYPPPQGEVVLAGGENSDEHGWTSVIHRVPMV